jgi:hypothetical protein
MRAQNLVEALTRVRVETMEQLVEGRELLVPREAVEASSVSISAVVSTDALAAGLDVFAMLELSRLLTAVLVTGEVELLSPGMAIEQYPGRYRTRSSTQLLSAPKLRTFSLG